MTLDLLRDEIWQQIGEPEDIDPDSDTQYESGPLLTWVVNEGLRTVATWVDPMTGREVRIPEKIGDMHFQSYYESGTLDADAPSASTIQLPTGASTTDDTYNGWVITLGSQDRYIVDYDGSTLRATLADDWDTEPDSGDEYELAKNFHMMLASGDGLESYHITKPTSGDYVTGNFLLPLKIVDLEDLVELEKAGRNEAFSSLLTSTGTPTSWYWQGNKLVFNYVPDEQRWYKMEYYRLPKTLSTSTDAPDIPEYLHYGIVLWGRWWGFARQMGQPEAYAAKKDFEDFMRQRLNLYAIEYLRDDDYGTVRLS